MPDNPNLNIIRPIGSEFIDKDGNRVRVIKRVETDSGWGCQCCYWDTPNCGVYKTEDDHSRGSCSKGIRCAKESAAFEYVKVQHINFMEE